MSVADDEANTSPVLSNWHIYAVDHDAATK